MQLGVVGLGRMGANIARRLLPAGFECIVFDRTRSAMEAVEASGARAAGVPAPVLSAALYRRFASRGENDFPDRLLSAMRFSFGGHEETPPR